MATVREIITRLSFKSDLRPIYVVEEAVKKLQFRLNLLIGIQGLKALASLSDSFGNFALDIRNSAEAAGLTTDEFQKLGYAAAQSGIRQEELGKTLGTLNKKLQAARLGSEEANLAFARAGITPEQVGSFHNAGEALLGLGESLNNIKDPILRAAVAQEILGEGSRQLLAAMNDSATGLARLSRSAEAAKSALAKNMLNSLIQSEQASIALKASLKSLTAQMLATLVPVLTVARRGLAAFVSSVRELTSTTWDKFVYRVGYAMGFTKGVIEDVSLVIIQTIRLLSKWGEDSGLFPAIAKGFDWIASAAGTALDAIGELTVRLLGKLMEFGNWFAAVDLKSLNGVARAFNDIGKAFNGWALDVLYNGLKGVYQMIGLIFDLLRSGVSGDGVTGAVASAMGNIGRKMGEWAGFEGPNLQPSIPALANASMPSAMAMSMPRMASPGVQPAAQGQGPIRIDAPVTINVAGTADPQKLYQSVKDGIADHHDKILRQAQNAATPAVVY